MTPERVRQIDASTKAATYRDRTAEETKIAERDIAQEMKDRAIAEKRKASNKKLIEKLCQRLDVSEDELRSVVLELVR